MQVDSPLLSSVLLYRAVYHDFAHQFIEDSGVKLLNVQVLVHQLQKLVHIGNLPVLCLDFPFQSSGKLLNLPPAPSHIAEIILSTGYPTLAQHIVLINVLDKPVQILRSLLRPGECFMPFRQFCLAAFLVLRQPFQLEILPKHTDLSQCLPDGFQHDPVKHLFPDIVDFTGAGVALVVGADEMVWLPSL